MEDMNTSYACDFLVPDNNFNEDSVDIYDGLDDGFARTEEESTPQKTPQLKDSMDLYEELVTEEQQNRETVYTELKSRFQAAQHQITELRKRLEQMETKNTGLNTENYRLKKNISALLQTARQEVIRKDAEIERLNKWSSRDQHYRHRFNDLQDQTSSHWTSKSSLRSRTPCPPHPYSRPSPCAPPRPTNCPLPCPAFDLLPRPNSGSPPHQISCPPPHLPPSNPPQPPPPPSNPPPPPPPSNPPPPPPPSSPPPPPPPSSPSPPSSPQTCPYQDGQFSKNPRISRTESIILTNQPTASRIETQAVKASSHCNLKSSIRGEGEISDKFNGGTVVKSSCSSSGQYCESDKYKSKHREEKKQSHKPSESTDKRSRRGSYANDDVSHTSEKNRSHKASKESHKADKDKGWKSDSRSLKSTSNVNIEGHHRSGKKDRRRSPPPDSSHSASSSDNSRKRSRESRQDKSKSARLGSERSAAHSSQEYHSRDHRRNKTDDWHSRGSDFRDRKKSSMSQHLERHSNDVDGGQLSKDHQKMENRQHEDRSSKKHKKSTDGEKQRKSKESGQDKDVSKERQEKTHESSKRSLTESHMQENILVEDNSPNRKLCFMETLNLTLSPIKKPMLPLDVPTSEDPVPECSNDEENSISRFEDMCVIDEAECSQLSSDCEDILKQPSNVLREMSPERTHKDYEETTEVLKEDERLTESPPSKVIEKGTVQATLVPNQPLENAESQQTVHCTLTSPDRSSAKDTRDVVSNSEVLDSLDDISESVEVKEGTGDTLVSIPKQHKMSSLQKENPCKTAPHQPNLLESSTEEHSAMENSSSREHGADTSTTVNLPTAVAVPVSPGHQHIPVTASPHNCLQEPQIPPSVPSSHESNASQVEDGPKETDIVSSTISLESVPQEGLSLTEAIYVLTQTSEDSRGSSTEPSSSTGCIAVSKVSSTTEEAVLLEKSSSLFCTPKKSFSPGRGLEHNAELPCPSPLPYDEDSMMRTLSNLKSIPDAISPLRSPMRITRRTFVHVCSKPGHVKSLQKDFCSPADDVNSKKLDVNKENKYPGSPVKPDGLSVVEKVSEMLSRLSETEPEEGEILSESDETSNGSPLPAEKIAQLVRPVRNKPSPKFVRKRKSEEKYVCPKEKSESPVESTPSPKRRFKTVCPAASKASYSSTEDIMEVFKHVRSEIRKKYMKLHKTFPRKSFYSMMDNYQQSFLEFVDGAQFGNICSQTGELKSKLKKQITSVFGKVSNNGIVKRIFEQQAVDLKHKLWDFVDAQVDSLFKDIHVSLKGLCSPTKNSTEGKKPVPPSVQNPLNEQIKAESSPSNQNQVKPCGVVPYKTGLGSRGKDIRITRTSCTIDASQVNGPKSQPASNLPLAKTIPLTPDKNSMASLVMSHSSSLLDKSDFELLTEQQASSLTFNLVRDSQMGEIFKCLLQGSDLLESSGITGDSTAWSLSTPKKDGERLISITTPTKFDSPSKLSPSKFTTPSKLIATWSSISPRKMSSPRNKDHIQLNPALFDESCLLELPLENKTMIPSGLTPHRSYSILAEDLAVSLTIPSPLKSDSRLSFLHPSSMHALSTPDSVISAHISEDALLDGEDVTEQDIHLALDTDNSSCGSGSSVPSPAHFLFKPDVPMQALVMEKSNDHFIVKIRQTAASADVTLIADETLCETITEEDPPGRDVDNETEASQTKEALWDKTQMGSASSCEPPSANSLCNSTGRSGVTISEWSPSLQEVPSPIIEDVSVPQCATDVRVSRSQEPSERNLPITVHSDHSLQSSAQSPGHHDLQVSKAPTVDGVTAEEGKMQRINEDMQKKNSPSTAHLTDSQKTNGQSEVSQQLHCHSPDASETKQISKESPSQVSDPERDVMKVSERGLDVDDKVNGILEKDQQRNNGGKKRKKHQEKSKAKRPRRKGEEECRKDTEPLCKNDDNDDSLTSPASLSPNNLSAKNLVKKKGEVVIAWTRDEDRTILIELKTNGASRETFSALAEKLKKPSAQISQRFNQLMKLFKKQEKMDS